MSDETDTRVEARWVGPDTVSVGGVVLDPRDPDAPTILVGVDEARDSDHWEAVKAAAPAPAPVKPTPPAGGGE